MGNVDAICLQGQLGKFDLNSKGERSKQGLDSAIGLDWCHHGERKMETSFWFWTFSSAPLVDATESSNSASDIVTGLVYLPIHQPIWSSLPLVYCIQPTEESLWGETCMKEVSQDVFHISAFRSNCHRPLCGLHLLQGI